MSRIPANLARDLLLFAGLTVAVAVVMGAGALAWNWLTTQPNPVVWVGLEGN